MIDVFIENQQHFDQIQYVFDTIFFTLGIKCSYKHNLDEIRDSGEDVHILYVRSDFETLKLPGITRNLIFIKDSSRLFGDDYLKPASIPLRTDTFRSDGLLKEPDGIISIYNDGDKLYIHTEEDKKAIKTNLDIISDIFFMLTRYEEVVSAGMIPKDKYDRFPAKESLAYKNSFLHRPVVNEHIELLWSWIESFSTEHKKISRWGQKDFAVCLSHDVDHIIKNGDLFAACRHTLAILLRLKKVKKAIHYLKNYFQNIRDYTKDPYWTFKYLTNTEKKYRFTSSFYFMAMEASDPDFRYDIHGKRVRELIHELEAQGCEVGYHGSLISYNNKRIMHLEKNRIDSVVSKKTYGCRQHYLKFKIPFTWRYQQQAGVLYDASLSFAEHEGFRCGMCFPFKPYDVLESKVLDIWEIPLIVMEGTLQSSMYRNLTPESGLKKIIDMIETVKSHHGVFTILWHNSSFDYNWDGWSYVYEEMMKYMGRSNCMGLSGRQMIEAISLNAGKQ